MVNSPLGKYAPLVASVAAIGIIAAYILSLFFGAALGMPSGEESQLQSLALIAAGAVFGSAVTVNGWKQPLTSAHSRLDNQQAQLQELALRVNSLSPQQQNVTTTGDHAAIGG